MASVSVHSSRHECSPAASLRRLQTVAAGSRLLDMWPVATISVGLPRLCRSSWRCADSRGGDSSGVEVGAPVGVGVSGVLVGGADADAEEVDEQWWRQLGGEVDQCGGAS